MYQLIIGYLSDVSSEFYIVWNKANLFIHVNTTLENCSHCTWNLEIKVNPRKLCSFDWKRKQWNPEIGMKVISVELYDVWLYSCVRWGDYSMGMGNLDKQKTNLHYSNNEILSVELIRLSYLDIHTVHVLEYKCISLITFR